ncbi:hypothetical protein ITP53_31655 [Nonomuraea sp. K274]|uniref:Uncharacterized protein n=1 Tax=Nonomuraea cypriaca TaxID=1187855 RepID=A0A931AGS7_9ACTN|nr:hypothetical protein [Nonomuraea cypriaca]MBF8190203.1 hypothetical protein [Nonomuraea cypriaca]
MNGITDIHRTDGLSVWRTCPRRPYFFAGVGVAYEKRHVIDGHPRPPASFDAPDEGTFFAGTFGFAGHAPPERGHYHPVMPATRSPRLRRPAAPAAWRRVAGACLALVMVITVLFANGCACAAVELSEQVAYSAGEAAGPPPARHDARCLRQELPVRHKHGTEQNCSAISPAGASTFLVPATVCLSSAPAPAGSASISAHAARPAATELENLCVLRI